jgi:hypothetical protein
MKSRHKYGSGSLLCIILLFTAMTVQADDWTSAGGVTTTLDPVGIGLAPPLAAKLHVLSTSNNSIMQMYGPSAATNGVPQGVLFSDTIGTEGYCCGVIMNLMGNSIIRMDNLQIGQFQNALIQSTHGAPLILNGSGVTGSAAGNVIIGYQGQPIGLRVLSSGNSSFLAPVAIGTTNPAAGMTLDVAGAGHFTGNVTVDGIIYAKYQDVAEWVPSDGSMPAGTVVILNPHKTNAVTPSTKAYDTAVAGVVSDQPGVLLGVGGENKAKIATTGRVKVHVDARAHAVHIGDLLVTSNIPGTAMLSEPLDLGGVKIHRPGTLIGKALEPLTGGEGEILVLLSLQ